MNTNKLYKGYNWILTGLGYGVLMVGVHLLRLARNSSIELDYLVDIPILLICGCVVSYMLKRSMERKPQLQSDRK